MSVKEFNILLSKIQCNFTEHNTIFREAVTPKEKLAFCLRLVTYCILLKENNFVSHNKKKNRNAFKNDNVLLFKITQSA